MADRYVVMLDTDYSAGRTVYDVLDLDTNEYFESSWSTYGAHDTAKMLNDGRTPRDTYSYAWKPLLNG